jgi:hypothetical protein
MTAGRTSVYDNDFFLLSTHPAMLSNSTLSIDQKTARAMMHILIQFPRLIVQIRRATADPQNVVYLASAISLAEDLWQLTQASGFADVISSSLSAIVDRVDEAIIDIVPHALRFNSAQSMVTCTRYLLLQVCLCGTLDTLRRKFPEAYGLSLLPDPDTLHRIDTYAATKLAQALLGLEDDASPLVFVRLHGPLSASIGSWHRRIRYLSSQQSTSQISASNGSDTSEDLFKAERMKRWLLMRCNVILKRLNISAVDERAWLEALDCMAGDEMPAWIPTKVTFGSERDETVMRLEYSEHRSTSPQDYFSPPQGTTRVFNVRNPSKFGPQHLREWIEGSEVTAIK